VTGLAQPVEIGGAATQRDHGRSCPVSPEESLAGRGEPRTELSTDSSYYCPSSRLLTGSGGLSLQVVGLVVSRSYPDLDTLPEDIGAIHTPRTIWVCAETDLEAKRLLVAYSALQLPLLPYWRFEGADLRRAWRDAELLTLCDKVYVFQKAGSKSTWNDWAKMPLVHPGVRLVEAGKVPKRKRAKGRALS
jgi:hypothetical protein